MYYPYLRGKQYELLALKELIKNNILSDNIIPIIEPVKLSPTLIKTLYEFIDKNKKVCVILNPEVGEFEENMESENEIEIELKKEFMKMLKNNDVIIKTHIIKKDSLLKIETLEKKYNFNRCDSYVIANDGDSLKVYEKMYKDSSPMFSFIPNENRFKRAIQNPRSIFENKFKKCGRNSDYADNCDEFFSEDHIIYNDEGFDGFSDYSIIGSEYSEGGFAPHAIAIHILYFDSLDNNVLRVRHFVSESNEDRSNPGQKFYEALTELFHWVKENDINKTLGLDIFLNQYQNESYHGLGIPKKLALMHHLELMGRYLDGDIL